MSLIARADSADGEMLRSQCTVETCDVQEYGWLSYIPSIPGNAVYLAIFTLLLLIQLGQAIRYKVFGGFAVGLIFGVFLEVLGYAGRILQGVGDGIFDKRNFVMQLVCLTIGPAFLSASIYICLGRVVIIYGRQNSRLRPATYSIIFITFDFISLVLQAVGGSIASTGKTHGDVEVGTHIMVAGLAFQIFSLSCFIFATLDFYLRVQKSSAYLNTDFICLRRTTLFNGFLYALGIATISITIRCIYRVVELAGGFTSPAANNQPSFMVLEGAMIIIAVVSLTVFHPGFAMKSRWHQADFRINAKKDKALAAAQDRMKAVTPNQSPFMTDLATPSAITLS